MLISVALLAFTTGTLAPPEPVALESLFLRPLYEGAPEETGSSASLGERPRFSVGLYFSDVEFDEIDAEGPQNTLTLEDVPRERIGAQIGFDLVYLRVYQEEIDELEGFGVGIGIAGPSEVGRFDDGVQTMIDYDVSLDFSFLDEDTTDAEVDTATIEAKLGFGFGYRGFFATAGIATSFVAGELDVPGFEEVDLDGQNAGFYLGVGFLPETAPIKARFDVLVGDIDGVAATLAFAF